MDRLTYISTAEAPFSADQLADLVRDAQVVNAEHHVTGCLLFNGVNFLQTIEGERAALGYVLARIQASTRHSGLVVVAHELDVERVFHSWQMCLLSLHAPETQLPASAPQKLRSIYANFEKLAGL